jgi:IS5 family transposase
MRRAKKQFGLRFSNHRLRAKRRVLAIANAKSAKARVPLYKDLVAVTESTLAEAESIAKQLDEVTCSGPLEMAQAQATATEIRALIPLANQVLHQTESRVFRGEAVPASEKIVSIFEPHTDIIAKGGREIEYGHKVCLTTGASALVTDIVVEQGNPADSTLAKRSIERHQALFGAPPRQACFDGGFATQNNVSAIKAMGVTDVVFHKRCGIEIEAMARSKRVYKKMRAFRAGIEGTISFLKRAFGLDRCAWRGFDSFRAYVHCGVLSCNLLVVARHVLAARS